MKITFVRSRDGKKRTLPVWFVLNGNKLELLPMYGLRTRWFQDVEKSGTLVMRARTRTEKASVKIVRDEGAVERAKERFGRKYGLADVKKYYPTSEVLLEILP
jgi:hypothetical protein